MLNEIRFILFIERVLASWLAPLARHFSSSFSSAFSFEWSVRRGASLTQEKNKITPTLRKNNSLWLVQYFSKTHILEKKPMIGQNR